MTMYRSTPLPASSITSFRPFPLFLLALLVFATHPSTAQDRERQQREIGSFSEVAYSLPGTLHLRQGKEQSLEIDAPQEVLDKIDTTIEGQTLRIRSEAQSNWLSWFLSMGNDLEGEHLDVYLTAPSIEKITVAGTGNVVGDTPIDGESLSVVVAGSSGLDLTVNLRDLEVNVAGSGTSRLDGRARTADVTVAGSGNVILPASNQLSATVAGSGNVRYIGDPQLDTSIYGSGSVRAKE